MRRKLLTSILLVAMLTVLPLTAMAVSARTERVPIQNSEEYVSDTYKRFVDVPANYWGKDGISYVVGKGLFNGTGTNTFSPEMPANRAMLCTVLHRFAGAPAVSGQSKYSDVKSGQWYTNGVIWAEQSGIFPSWIKKATKFEPNSSVSRGEFAVTLRNYYVWSGGNRFNDGMSGIAVLFPDLPTGSRAYEINPAVSWLYTYSILNGTGANTMSPNAPFTRSQFAAMLERYDRQFGTGVPNTPTGETATTPTGGNSNTNTPTVEVTATGLIVNDPDENEKLIQLINDYRAENGLPRLVKNEKLMEAAAIRAKEAAFTFSHTRPDGTFAATVLEEVGMSNDGYFMENLYGGLFANNALKAWKKSPGHNTAMLTPYSVSSIGVGSYTDGKSHNAYSMIIV